MSCLSTMGSCSPVSWPRWVQTSRAERPSRRMQEFVFAVAGARVTSDTDPLSGDKFKSSKPSSSMARSAKGFLLGFLTLPISKVIPWERRIGCVASAQKPGAGSTRTVAPPSCKERSWEHKTIRALRKSSCFSLLMRVVKVYEATSAANEIPMERGASSLDWGWKCLGIDFTDSQI